MKFFYTIVLLLCSVFLSAQSTVTVSGTIKAQDGKPLELASIKLTYESGSDSLTTSTNKAGIFSYRNIRREIVTLNVTFIGYEPVNKKIDITEAGTQYQIPDIILQPGATTLQNVTLEAQKIQIKEDTVSYLIDSTMFRKNDNVEALLKKLPGIQVDRSGTVTAQGKEVTKVKVNGKEFFGGDVRTATRELNADMVDRIQVIDDYGDQSAFTGIKDGDPTKTLNIDLKKDKNKGYFGNLTAGAGTDKRYLSNVSLNRFNDAQQISFLGSLNNTNASTFNFGAIGGPMGNMISSMVRGMGIGQGGGGVGALLGNFGLSDGVGRTGSLGLNYRDEWGKKLSAYGSYSYTGRDILTIRDINQQNFFRNFQNTRVETSYDETKSDNHRFSFNVEYRIDSFNFLKFNPTLTLRKTRSEYTNSYSYFDKNGARINTGNLDEYAVSDVPGLNGSLLLNHRFHKTGRTMSVNLSAGNSATDGTDDILNQNTYFLPIGIFDSLSQQFIRQDNDNRNYGVRISYNEPIDKKRSVEFNYGFNYQFTDNERDVFSVDTLTDKRSYADSLSTIYDNTYLTHRLGINFRTNQKKFNYTVGLAVQPGSIESRGIDIRNNYRQTIVNFFPVVRFAYNFSRSRAFNVNYNGMTNQPSYTQLNPVKDNSNQQNIFIGNPALRPEFSNTLSTRYNNFDFVSGNVFFGSIAVSYTDDKIVTDTRPLGMTGVQETRYRNADGFYTLTGFYNISRPRQNRKYVFNWGGNVIYNHNVSFIESLRNIGRNWIIGQRLSLDFKAKKWLETSSAVNYSFNSTKYSLKNEQLQNLDIHTWGLSHSGKIFLTEDFFLSYELDKTINSGYTEFVNANPFIINATIERQVFKKRNVSLRLQAYDILNQNKGISRNVTAAAITDTRVNRLARYFMGSLVFRLNKFRASQQMPAPGGGMMPMQGPGGMMRPF